MKIIIAALLVPTFLANVALADFGTGFLGGCTFKGFSRGEQEKDPAVIYECPLKDGAKWPHVACSRVQLNDCFVNDRGTLAIREKGGFGHSCKDCNYDNKRAVLSCSCGDGAGGQKDTWIRIDQAVRTYGGKVHCYGILPGNNCSF